MSEYLRLLRVNQYIKNLLIFAPIFFSFNYSNLYLLKICAISCFLFCLLSSVIYIINDICDIEKDKLHPYKKYRPLANGDINKKNALILAIILICLSFIGSFLLNKSVFLFFLVYFVFNILYSLKLKKIPILDLIAISFFYIIRILIGSAITGIISSNWLYIMTFLVALVVAIAKRRGEYILSNGEKLSRHVLEYYNKDFLDFSLILISGITIVSYILYTVSERTIASVGSEYVFVTIFWVIVGFLRFLQSVLVFNKLDDPVKFIYKDNVSKLIVLLWILNFVIIKVMTR